MTKTKIIFMGTPDFAATVLEGLLRDESYDIVAVVTQPDRKVGRKQQLQATPVKTLALAHDLLVLQPEKLSGSEEMQALMALGADGAGIVTAAFGQFLPGKLLDSVKFAVNVHGSLLPWGRGGAPIQRAIMAGYSEIGVTLIEMLRKMDAGRMLAQAGIPCLPEDNTDSMFAKLAVVGRDLLLENLPKYLAGQLELLEQDESKVVITPNIAPEEEIIDWTQPAETIFNQIRGLSSQPGAHTLLDNQRFKIYKSKLSDTSDKLGQPGQIIAKTKKSLTVAAGTGSLDLLEVQPAGKPKMDITSFLNGLGQKLKVGDAFGK